MGSGGQKGSVTCMCVRACVRAFEWVFVCQLTCACSGGARWRVYYRAHTPAADCPTTY